MTDFGVAVAKPQQAAGNQPQANKADAIFDIEKLTRLPKRRVKSPP
jgi:hypothetical protein